MPKRYADSIDFQLRRFDQLKTVHAAQSIELVNCKALAQNLEDVIVEQDSMSNLDAALYNVQGNTIKRKNKTIAIIIGVAIVEFILMLTQ